MSDQVASSNVNTGVVAGSGRVRIVTEPALPAVCVMCRRSANGAIKFIDFQFDLDYYGAVVFCEDCIKESLSLLDYTHNINFTNKVQELEMALEKLEVAQNECAKYKSIIANLRDVGFVDLVDDNESTGTEESTESSESTDEGSMETESDSNGSDSVGGLKNVSIFAD